MNLLIIGAPGSGKGTMSDLLIKDYDIDHISTGDMLRNAVASKTPLGLQAKESMDAGILVSDEIVNGIISEHLSNCDKSKGFLFDGYPRTLSQAEAFKEILNKLGMKIDAVINLEIADEIVTKRALGRRTCPKCGTAYNIYFLPPKVENKCDVCGNELVTRKDDNAESFKVRLTEFHKNVKPIIEYYEKDGLVKNINADQTIEKQYADIKKSLEGIQ